MAVRLAKDTGQTETVPLERFYDLLASPQLIEILCVQERGFGASGLEPLEVS